MPGTSTAPCICRSRSFRCGPPSSIATGRSSSPAAAAADRPSWSPRSARPASRRSTWPGGCRPGSPTASRSSPMAARSPVRSPRREVAHGPVPPRQQARCLPAPTGTADPGRSSATAQWHSGAPGAQVVLGRSPSTQWCSGRSRHSEWCSGRSRHSDVHPVGGCPGGRATVRPSHRRSAARPDRRRSRRGRPGAASRTRHQRGRSRVSHGQERPGRDLPLAPPARVARPLRTRRRRGARPRRRSARASTPPREQRGRRSRVCARGSRRSIARSGYARTSASPP